ncbi:MAG: diguanylate cyclase [Eubacteriales bacterium]|nr:diguanylate cyclase [Eubacteriales bacterium]MDD4134384.1 diguanylate cyclase [Eubacteriales bacterium]NLO14137.1 diguanylate cyclase [Clostridiales bacterium]
MTVVGGAAALTYNAGIGIFSCAITLVIWYFYKRNFADTHDIGMLRRIEASLLVVLLSDIGMWLLDGRAGGLIRVMLYVINIINFLMAIVVAIQWLEYAWFRIYRREMPGIRKMVPALIPFGLTAVFILSSPWTGWSFYLDDANVYHRGEFAILQYLVLLAYLLGASVMALIQRKKEAARDRRAELLTIAFFTAPPLMGGLVQTAFYGLNLIWPCAVISSLLVLLNKAGEAISQDTITGLNNRRNLEKHLRQYDENQDRPVTLMMLDIDAFKRINDQHGHSAGDQAIMEAAQVLKKVFGGSSAFLSRFGGDEFVVVIPGADEGKAQAAITRIHASFEALSAEHSFPFQLSVSAGYAMSEKTGATRTAELLKTADKRMYEAKARAGKKAE